MTIILIDSCIVIAVSTPVGILFILCAELFGEFKKVINAALRPVKNAVVPTRFIGVKASHSEDYSKIFAFGCTRMDISSDSNLLSSWQRGEF
jgi:hypothetical protein